MQYDIVHSIDIDIPQHRERHQREAGPGSLLLAELGMEHLPEDLPLLKAAWLTTGDSPAFRRGLLAITSRCWSVSVAKFEPIAFTALEVSTSQAEG